MCDGCLPLNLESCQLLLFQIFLLLHSPFSVLLVFQLYVCYTFGNYFIVFGCTVICFLRFFFFAFQFGKF